MENHKEDFEQTKIQTDDDRSQRRKKIKCIKLETERKKKAAAAPKSNQFRHTGHLLHFYAACDGHLAVFFFLFLASKISWLLIRNRIDSNIYTFTFYEVANGEKCMQELCTCVKSRPTEGERERAEGRGKRYQLFSRHHYFCFVTDFGLLLLAAARNLFVVSTIFYGRSSI